MKKEENRKITCRNFKEWDLLKQMYSQNPSVQFIADFLGTTTHQCRYLLKKIGITPLDSSYDKIDDETLADLHFNQLISAKEIAKMYETNLTLIYNRLFSMGMISKHDPLEDQYPCKEIAEFYLKGYSTMDLPNIFNLSLSTIRRCLDYMGVKRRRNKEATQLSWMQGKHSSSIAKRRTTEKRFEAMVKSLDYPEGSVTLDFVRQFDFEKVKYFNHMLPNHNSQKYHKSHSYKITDPEQYKQTMEMFMSNPNYHRQFKIMNMFKDKEKRLRRPHSLSLDHKKPVVLFDGDLDAANKPENLQPMSFFENCLKYDMTMNEFVECVRLYYGETAAEIIKKKYGVTE